MKSDMVNMNEKIEKMERIVDRQEQYSRCNCLLLHGIAQGEPENTEELVLETLYGKTHIDLATLDLGRTDRIGQKKASRKKPRAVIMGIWKEAREKHQFRNVWTAKILLKYCTRQ